MKRIRFFIFLSLLISSCEKVIQVDLNEADPRIVVEGNITTGAGPDTIRLTQTANYFGLNEFPIVTGAKVKIADDAGNNELLSEPSPGIYLLRSLRGVSGRTYFLDVVSGDKNSTAKVTMQKTVAIDSLVAKYNDGTSGFLRKGYYVSVYFQDPSEKNYYKIKVKKNAGPATTVGNQGGTNESGPTGGGQGSGNSDFTFDDYLFSGSNAIFPLRKTYQRYDTLTVQLFSFDKSAYEFFTTLDEISSGRGSVFGSVPQNPTTNLSGNAVGYFGAFAVDDKKVIVK